MKFNKIYNSNQNLKVNFLPFNRATTRAHTLELAQSMRDHGWFGTVILIWTNLYSKNFKYYVIDGQHRVTAAEIVGIVWRYEIKEVSTHEEVVSLMADLNNNSKGWFLHDYLQPWASLGYSNYRALSTIFTRTRLPLASLITLYSGNAFGSAQGGSNTRKFKKGALVLKNKALGDEITDEIIEMQKVTGRLSHAVIMGFADFYVTKRKSFSRPRLLKALKSNKAAVRSITRTVDAREVLKKIY